MEIVIGVLAAIGLFCVVGFVLLAGWVLFAGDRWPLIDEDTTLDVQNHHGDTRSVR